MSTSRSIELPFHGGPKLTDQIVECGHMFGCELEPGKEVEGFAEIAVAETRSIVPPGQRRPLRRSQQLELDAVFLLLSTGAMRSNDFNDRIEECRPRATARRCRAQRR
jgi:hypothetical protein